MGAVLLARDKAIQRELAVKVMRPQIADSEEHRLRFLEEAQVTGQLEHPNIVPIHDLGKDADGNLYFTMKLVKGKSLGEILKAQRSSALQSGESEDAGLETSATMATPGTTHHWSLAELLGVLLKICDGMAFAHSRGVIHRDLKPDNIMVGEFGEVQIMDWGLAKVLARSEERGAGGEGSEEDQRPETKDQRPEAEGGGANVQRPTPNAQHSTEEQKSETEIRKANTVPDGAQQSAIRNQESVRSVRSDSDVALTVEGQITGTPT